MRCPICNSEVADNYKFCTKCGLRISPSMRPTEQETKTTQKSEPTFETIPPVPVQPWKTEPAPEPVQPKTKKVPGVMVAAIAAVVVIAGGVMIFGKKEEPVANAATTEAEASISVESAVASQEPISEEIADDETEVVKPTVTTAVTSYDDEDEDGG